MRANENRVRMAPSDLNKCLMETVFDDKAGVSYPKPLFTGFISCFAGKEQILKQKSSEITQHSPQTDQPSEKLAIEPEGFELVDEQLDIPETDLIALRSVDPIYNSSYKIIDNQLIIVHAAVDTTIGASPENASEELFAALREQGINLEQYKITHIIPEIGKGRFDGFFGVNHIRLRIARGHPICLEESQLIDPRDIHQSTFDVTNCGRYVTTMIGQAVGLQQKNQPITPESLKISPIVKNAAKFTTSESLKQATLFASENPIDIASQEKKVEKIIAQIQQMKHVYEQRERLGLHYNTFFGSCVRQIFGNRVGRVFGCYSAQEKHQAANAIISAYNKGESEIDSQSFDPANQGELGKLYSQYKTAMEEVKTRLEQTDSDEPSIDDCRSLK